MAKVAKTKKREISQNSRAARRGASPENKIEIKGRAEETDYKPWLHSATAGGISKKKKGKQLTRQQKERQAKGLEHAERNLDKLEKKVEDSKARSRRVTARRTQWEDLNAEEGFFVLSKDGRKLPVAPTTAEGGAEIQAAKATGAMEDVQIDDAAEPVTTTVTQTTTTTVEPTAPGVSVDDIDDVA